MKELEGQDPLRLLKYLDNTDLMFSKARRSAFTLIELIIVIAIISILAGAIFVAIDPARRLHESRNAVRASDVVTILEAVKKYQTDNDGDHYTVVSGLTAGDYYVIGTNGTGCNGVCAAQNTELSCKDLSGIGTTYLSEVPMDPFSGTEDITDYYIMRGINNEITVGACEPEKEGLGGAGDEPEIEVSR